MKLAARTKLDGNYCIGMFEVIFFKRNKAY